MAISERTWFKLPGPGRAQERFEVGKREFDRIEIRTVGL